MIRHGVYHASFSSCHGDTLGACGLRGVSLLEDVHGTKDTCGALERIIRALVCEEEICTGRQCSNTRLAADLMLGLRERRHGHHDLIDG